MTVVARMLRALALSGCVAMAAAGCSPVSHSPAAGSSASPGSAATSVSPIPTWDDQQPWQGPGPLGPRMYWALIMAGSGHPKRILFADTYNLGGRAVYYDTRDTATTITCTASCARRWLPLLESDLRRGSLPFSARTLSYVDGPDGRQVEYEGHPLYVYAGDSSVRQIEGSGDGTDETWFAVTPDLKSAS